jgi:hypothetical protein
MGAGDLFTAASILAGAGWLLYRSLLRPKSGGGCHGCSGGCGRKTPETTVVRLGAPPRPHGGGPAGR